MGRVALRKLLAQRAKPKKHRSSRTCACGCDIMCHVNRRPYIGKRETRAGRSLRWCRNCDHCGQFRAPTKDRRRRVRG